MKRLSRPTLSTRRLTGDSVVSISSEAVERDLVVSTAVSDEAKRRRRNTKLSLRLGVKVTATHPAATYLLNVLRVRAIGSGSAHAGQYLGLVLPSFTSRPT